MKKRLYNLPNKIIAVTGGIASGKTTLCKKLEKKGKYVFYADKIVKKIYQKDCVLDYLWLELGKNDYYRSVLKCENKVRSLDFKILRKKVCEYPNLLKKLEKLVSDHFEGEFLKEYVERGLNIPEVWDLQFPPLHPRYTPSSLEYKDIYLEYAPEKSIDIKLFDDVIRCEALRDVRIERIVKRDGCSRETAEKMIEIQEDPK